MGDPIANYGKQNGGDEPHAGEERRRRRWGGGGGGGGDNRGRVKMEGNMLSSSKLLETPSL